MVQKGASVIFIALISINDATTDARAAVNDNGVKNKTDDVVDSVVATMDAGALPKNLARVDRSHPSVNSFVAGVELS